MAPILYKGTELATAYFGNESASPALSSLVTNGLILNLDAGNPKSYTSGSTTIFDLSGNGNNGTLQNGVVYVPDNNGALEFPSGGFYATASTGIYNNIRVDDSSTLDTMGSGITVEMWINPQIQRQTGFNRSNTLFSKRAGSTDGMLGLFTTGLNTTPAQITFRFGTSPPGGQNVAIWNHAMVTGSWQQLVCATGGANDSSVGTTIYKDGVPRVNLSYSGSFTNINNNANLLIGDINPATANLFAYQGLYGIFRIYNRKLTNDEVKQNFDTFRHRYGI